jgi:hypothetical protein
MAYTIDDLAYDIRLENVIPIVGFDLLSDPKANGGGGGDFLKQLIGIHAASDGLEKKYPKAKTGNDLIDAYYHDLDPNARRHFKQKVSETIRAQRHTLQLTPESYLKLVSISHFSLFINATFTNSLELALNACRATGADPAEVKSSYRVLDFHPLTPDDLPEHAPPSKFTINFDKPVIYNLFGTHDDKKGNYLLTDSDYIELIYDLIENRGNRFTNLLSYLQKGNLLFLGCNFPDWFFRFFIRICVGDRLDNVIPINRQSVIDSLNAVDTTRTIFIDQYGIQKVVPEIDSNRLVDELFQKLQRDGGVLEFKENNLVFISYCSADDAVCADLAKQFDERYIDYFRDKNNLRTGDNLHDKIKGAIRNCCVFMPIVSANVQAASCYIWAEWEYALSIGKTIWPVYKEFVNPDMLTKCAFVGAAARARREILSKNLTLGVDLTQGDNRLSDVILNRIKDAQYIARVSGEKTIT